MTDQIQITVLYTVELKWNFSFHFDALTIRPSWSLENVKAQLKFGRDPRAKLHIIKVFEGRLKEYTFGAEPQPTRPEPTQTNSTTTSKGTTI